jgi:membrane protease YdiL (CAAX protease family)
MNNRQTVSFLAAFVILFVLFRGLGFLSANFDWTVVQILICVVVAAGATLAWSRIKKVSLAQSFRAVGFGVPTWSAIAIAIMLSAVMLTFFPIYARLNNVELPLISNWPWILVGIITGTGIAEESLFRGYVFNFLRENRTFWRAATLSMILFGAMHLLLLLWLPLPIAIAAIILAIIAAYPTAYLFEAANRTIWPSAILHATALATNLFSIPAQMTVSISLLWIGVVVIGLFLVFVAGRLLLKNTSQPA